MKIKIMDIPDEGLHIEGSEKFNEAEENCSADIHYSFNLHKSSADVHIGGEIEGYTIQGCGRCLKETRCSLNLPISLVYSPASEMQGAGERELLTEELNTEYYSGDELDIGGIAKEQVLLSLPMKPLCKEDCKGICLLCGADLNEVLCGCKTDNMDTRFEPLAKYFRKEQ